MEYNFLSLEDVLEIHSNQIAIYGGSDAIRDMNLLLSAIEMPKSGFENNYFHQNIYEMAAAYLFHIVQNHPFIDGNKRTGLVCAFMFLLNNDVATKYDTDEIYELVLNVAQGKADKKVISEFFKNH